MRRIHFFFLIVCISILFSNCVNKNKKATILAEIENMGNDTIMIAIAPYNKKFSNNFVTLHAHEGKFKLDTLIGKLHYGKIFSKQMFKKLSNGEDFLIRSKMIDFFILPNEKIEINGKLEEFKTKYYIKGNKLNLQFQHYRESIIADYLEENRLMFQIENHYINNSADSLINILSQQERKAYKAYLEKSLMYVEENPDFEISAFLLLKEQKEDIVSLFPRLNEEVKESVYGKLIQEKIDVWNKIKIGSEAPDFEYLTSNNQKIHLSDYRGKYVVLDFWGSWCGSCKMEIPRLKKFQSENKESIEMIGIACRDTRVKWEKAIKEYNLNWTQILNDKKKLDLRKMYGITGFPTKVIIEPNGIIEGFYLGVSDDFFIKMKKLLKENKTAANNGS